MKLASLLSWSLLPVLVLGCNCGKEDKTPVLYTEGLSDGALFQSSAVDGTWLHFPGGRRYRFEHRLGRAPSTFIVYLSFVEVPFPAGGGDGSDATIGSGDTAVIEETTPEYFVVHNNTCSEFYLRALASLSPLEVDGAGGGSAGGGGAVAQATVDPSDELEAVNLAGASTDKASLGASLRGSGRWLTTCPSARR